MTRFRLAARLSLRRILQRTIPFVRRQPTSRFFLWGSVLIMVVYTLSIIWTALSNALAFNGFAADGAFQLLNPLRRLAAGQAIGSDFNFFHGIGVPLIHLPFYLLFGQGLFASELSRWLVSPIVFAGTALCFFYAFRRQWKFALPMTAAAMAFGLTAMSFFSLAGNSLLGVRSSMPVILLAVMLSYDRLQQPLFKKASAVWLRSITRYEALIGATLAASILCGTEFGVAAILAFTISYLAYPIKQRLAFRQRLLGLARVAALFVVVLLVVLAIITRGNPLKPLIYAFVDIPSDQSWYFGVPPNTFMHLGNIVDLFVRFQVIHVIFLLAIMVGLIVWRVHRHIKDRMRVQAFICGLLAGVFAMVSMLGYFDPSETYALQRMSILIGAAAFVLLWERWKKPIRFGVEIARFKKRITIRPQQFIVLACVVFVGYAIVWSGLTLVNNEQQYSIGTAVRKLKNYVFGLDTNNLSDSWNNTDSVIMPIIQANNTVAIADVNDNGFSHGISTTNAQLIVEPGSHASFVRPGQIVYFVRSGRQIIKQVEKRAGAQLLVTLQNKEFKLDPSNDGAPHKLVIAEDFNHDNTKVWSLYTSLFESEMKVFNNSHGYDYIIHALGPQQRAQYLSDFEHTKPQFVVTLSRNYFIYEEWLQNSHWDLYSLIEQNYEVIAESPIHVLWKRKDQPWSDTNQDIQGWQKLDITINNATQTERITLPKLSFDNVPDVDSFIQNYAASERARLQSLGLSVPPDLALNEEQYAQYIADQELKTINHNLLDSENSGPITAAQEQQANDAQHRAALKTADQQPYLRTPRPKRQVVLIKLNYEITHPLSGLPLIGKTTRYFIEENNVYTKTPVSLRPYASQIIFPIVISEDSLGNAYLVPNTYSLIPGGRLHITSAEWTPLNAPVKTLKVLTDQMP